MSNAHIHNSRSGKIGMVTKSDIKQRIRRREPQQARALGKIELILEAAMRLIERNGIDLLTTNAIAELAGVSIGTLYQYFKDKDAILAALEQRELAGLSARVLKAVNDVPPRRLGGRIPIIIDAVLSSYGGRRRVHRLLLERALSRGPGTRLAPLYIGLIGLLAAEGVSSPNQTATPMKPADAFVLTYAVSGVIRAAIATENRHVARSELEDALTRLVVSFVRGATALAT